MAPDIAPQTPDDRVDAIVSDLNQLSTLVEGTDTVKIDERIASLKKLMEEKGEVKKASQVKLELLQTTIGSLKETVKQKLTIESLMPSISELQNEVKTRVNDILAEVENDEKKLEENPMGYVAEFMDSLKTKMDTFKDNPIGGITGLVTMFMTQVGRLQDFWAAKAGPLGKALKPITGGSSFGVDAPRQNIVDALLKKNPNEKLKGKTIRVIREAMAAMQGQGVDDVKLLEALVNAHAVNKIPKTEEERTAFLAPLKSATPAAVPGTPEALKPEPVFPATVDFAAFKAGVEVPGYGKVVINESNQLILGGVNSWKLVAKGAELPKYGAGIKIDDAQLDANKVSLSLMNNVAGAPKNPVTIAKAEFVKMVKHMDKRVDPLAIAGTEFSLEK